MSEMLKNEAVKGPSPKRNKIAIAVGAVVVASLITGGILGVNAANTYRADIEAMQTSAAAFYDAAAEQQALAQAAADRAQESAVAASESVTSLEAAEAEAAAQAAADEAAAQAAATEAAANSSSGYAGNAPAGTPIPMHTDNDPNSGSYGQSVIGNPDEFCASNGGTTRADGVAVCS